MYFMLCITAYPMRLFEKDGNAVGKKLLESTEMGIGESRVIWRISDADSIQPIMSDGIIISMSIRRLPSTFAPGGWIF